MYLAVRMTRLARTLAGFMETAHSLGTEGCLGHV